MSFECDDFVLFWTFAHENPVVPTSYPWVLGKISSERHEINFVMHVAILSSFYE